MLPVKKTREAAQNQVDKALGLSAATPIRFMDTHAGRVLLTRDKVTHITAKFYQGDHRERYANRILPTLAEPNEIWLTAYAKGEKIEFRRTYIKVFEGEKLPAALSIVIDNPGEPLLWTFFTTTYRAINARRRGTLLYPKK